MKKYKYLILIFILYSINSYAEHKKPTDTIYVMCYQEDLTNKFYNLNQNKNQLRIQYLFDVKWELFGYKQNSFFLFYEGPEKLVRNEWSIPTIKSENIKQYKNLYTLEQFTKALGKQHFRLSITEGKVYLIMLYGEKCSTNFEVYPVKVGTNLSNEG